MSDPLRQPERISTNVQDRDSLVKRTLDLGSGLVGAASVTLLNYLGKRYLPRAPRLDIIGLRLMMAAFNKAGIEPPRAFPLKIIALIGDLISNSIFYGLVGLGKPRTAWLRGGALGLAIGIGAVALPGTLGMGNDTTARTPMSKAGTIAWYVLGGLLAALTFAASHANAKGGAR
jgi:hypothetical protein